MYARISASRPPSGAIAAFAGGALDTTLLSSCSGALLACLDTAAALPLRAACRELRDAVARYPWATDARRPIRRGNVEAWRVGLPLEDLRAGHTPLRLLESLRTGQALLRFGGARESRASLLDWASAVPRARGPERLAQWRACFPRAVAARLDASRVRNEDLASLGGVAEVLLDRTLERILPQRLFWTDHEHGWDLDNEWMTLPPAPLPTFSDAALQQLAGVRVLSLRGCCQLTDAALAPLAPALRDLDVSYCTQLTDAALAPLSGLCVLAVGGCTGVTDAALARLAPQLRALDIAHCPQLTGAAFAGALRLERLRMRGCSQSSIGDAHFAGLQGLAELDMSRCTQATLTPALFEALTGLRVLIADCVGGIPEHVWRRLDAARGVELGPARPQRGADYAATSAWLKRQDAPGGGGGGRGCDAPAARLCQRGAAARGLPRPIPLASRAAAGASAAAPSAPLEGQALSWRKWLHAHSLLLSWRAPRL